MNFILIISVCSLVAGACLSTGESEKKYDTWNECMQDAMKKSQIIMKEIPVNQINELKLATKYFCYEKEKTKV